MAAVPGPRPDGLLLLLIPRSDYEIADTWFASGMRGTGSKDIVVNDVFVPAHRVMDPNRAGDGDWTGWELHRRLSCPAPGHDRLGSGRAGGGGRPGGGG